MDHHFAPAFRDDTIVFGACRPGYPATEVSETEVQEWIQFMKQQGIQRVVCLLDSSQLAYYGDLLGKYRAAFGEANVASFPIADYTNPTAEALRDEILPVLEESVKVNRKTVVHCSAGVGRTGFVLAAYLESVRSLNRCDAIAEVKAAGRCAG